MRCSICDGGFCKISKRHFGCSTARNKGDTACTNRLTVRLDRLQSAILDGLRERLMDAVLFEAFAAEFTAESNRLQAALLDGLTARRRKLAKTQAKLEKLVDALCDGTPAIVMRDRMQVLDDRRIALEAELAEAIAPALCLHPNLAIVYREKVGRSRALLRPRAALALRTCFGP